MGLFLFIVGRYFGSDTGGVISQGRKVAGPGGFYTLYGNFALICDGNYGRQRVFGVPGVSAHPKGAIWHEFFARKIALGIKAAYLFPVGVGIMGLGLGLPQGVSCGIYVKKQQVLIHKDCVGVNMAVYSHYYGALSSGVDLPYNITDPVGIGGVGEKPFGKAVVADDYTPFALICRRKKSVLKPIPLGVGKVIDMQVTGPWSPAGGGVMLPLGSFGIKGIVGIQHYEAEIALIKIIITDIGVGLAVGGAPDNTFIVGKQRGHNLHTVAFAFQLVVAVNPVKGNAVGIIKGGLYQLRGAEIIVAHIATMDRKIYPCAAEAGKYGLHIVYRGGIHTLFIMKIRKNTESNLIH